MQDNEQRKIQEEKAAARRKLQEMKSEKKDGKVYQLHIIRCGTIVASAP